MATRDDRQGTRANGPAIRAARKAHGLSQEQLAAKVGCAEKTLRQAEQGKGIRITTLAEIATALGTDVSQFLAEEERAPLTSTPPALGLTVPDRQFNPDRSPPGALLRAEFRQVPFHGRETEVRDLDEWCEAQDDLRLRLYTGPGGMGKTRLAVETCHTYRKKGWLSGFVDDQVPDFNAAGTRPVLLVLDYAETRDELLLELVDQALARTNGKTRILILARAALEWWHRLPSARGEIGEFFLSRLVDKVRLTPLALDDAARVHTFKLARSVFAEVLGLPEPQGAPPELGDDIFERVLLIHMLALSNLERIETKGEHGILDVMLARERRHWRDHAEAAGLPQALWPALGQAMAVATLAGGAPLGDAAATFSKLPLLADQSTAIREQIVRLLHATYPGEGMIEPLMPDILGEHLVQTELAGQPEVFLAIALGPRA